MHILILFLTVKFWFTTSLKKCYIWENIIGGMKENILKKAGKYNKRVGNNPDIKVLADGSITLQVTDPFKGKSMKTDLKIETFFEDD